MLFLALLFRLLFDLRERDRNVFKHRQVVEEIELLEHHADLLSVLVHIKALGRDVLALEVNFAGGGLLQEVQASDKGGLTAARGTDDDDHVALADGLAQPVEVK